MVALNNLSLLHQRIVAFTDQSENMLRHDPSIAYKSEVLFWIIFAIGLLANLIVALVIIIHRKILLKIPSNVLLLSLSIADIISLLGMIGLRIYAFTVTMEYVSASIMIKAEGIFTAFELMLSGWTVTALAIFNFTAVIFPMKFRAYITRGRSITVALLIWFFAICLSIPVQFFPRIADYVTKGNISFDLYAEDMKDEHVTYLLILDGLIKIPPWLAIIFLYPIILYTLLKKRFKKVFSRSDSFRKSIDNSMKYVSFIYALFLVFLTLDFSVSIVMYRFIFTDALLAEPISAHDYSLLKYLTIFLEPFQSVHTIFNPFIHGLCTDNFLKYYMPECCRKKIEKTSVNT